MGKSLEEMLARMPARLRRRVEKRGAELVAEEMTLRELRKAMGRTQTQVARITGKPQATISRMEAQSDMLLSNLNQVVEAMGGRVRIMAELPGRAPVFLTGLGDLAPAPKPTPARAPRKAVAPAAKPMASRRSKATTVEPDAVGRGPAARRAVA